LINSGVVQGWAATRKIDARHEINWGLNQVARALRNHSALTFRSAYNMGERVSLGQIIHRALRNSAPENARRQTRSANRNSHCSKFD